MAGLDIFEARFIARGDYGYVIAWVDSIDGIGLVIGEEGEESPLSTDPEEAENWAVRRAVESVFSGLYGSKATGRDPMMFENMTHAKRALVEGRKALKLSRAEAKGQKMVRCPHCKGLGKVAIAKPPKKARKP